MNPIRAADEDDIDLIADLMQEKRLQYASYQPLFWRVAPSAVATHKAFLSKMISDEHTIALVWQETRESIEGFILAIITGFPPAYDPGDPTCMIDDYWVRGDQERWNAIGQALLDGACTRARSEFGAAQVVVVCAHKDVAKRSMLRAEGLAIASEWYVKAL